MSNAQKTPLARTLPRVIRRAAVGEIERRWAQLPGKISAINSTATAVTVEFDVAGLDLKPATMPVAMSKYVRFPLVVGDPGLAISASAYVGALSGLGVTTPPSGTLQPNLMNLVWVPFSSGAWPSDDPNDCVITDSSGAAVETLSSSGFNLAFGGNSIVFNSSEISLTFGSHSVVINSSGVTIDGILWDTHEHGPGTYVAGSTAVTGLSAAPQSP